MLPDMTPLSAYKLQKAKSQLAAFYNNNKGSRKGFFINEVACVVGEKGLERGVRRCKASKRIQKADMSRRQLLNWLQLQLE